MHKIFIERIKQLRESQGLTKHGLAAKLGIGNNSIVQYESGIRTPNIELLEKYADYFNVTTDYLLGRAKNRY
jgi:transcriptional regulator with XRE-family HTH domain